MYFFHSHNSTSREMRHCQLPDKQHQPALPEDKARVVYLDLVRFIAAMAVVIFHYKSKYLESLPSGSDTSAVIYSITKFGYLGVDLFFMISGYVIFASAMNRSPWEFLTSRATRIYPTFWVCATITLLTIIVFSDSSSFTIFHYLINLTLLHEILGVPAIDGVYWTLVVELKFYACVFMLSLLGLLKFYRIWLSIWLIATFMFVFYGQPFFMGWFISPEYSPYFISGIVFYLVQREGYNKLYSLILGLGLVLALRHAFHAVDSFAQDISLLDRYIVMTIVFSFFVNFYLISRNKIGLKYRRVYLVLGGMTYPLYLLHNAIGKIVYDNFIDFLQPFPLLLLITITVMGLSYAINLSIEKRLANHLKYFLFDKLERGSVRSLLGSRQEITS